MILVYIAGPIRKGDIWRNVAQADDAMLALMRAGASVVNPMLSCWSGLAGQHGALTGPHASGHGAFRDLPADTWLEMDLEMVRRCDAVLRLPGESVGADGEVACAEACAIRVFHSVEALIHNLPVIPQRFGGDR